MNSGLHRRLERAIERIESSLGETLTLGCIADAAHLSPYHFARVFRAVYGDSVMHYARRRRLSEAVVMLRDTDQAVLDIAIACGFGSNEAFTRAFRKQYGIAPATYRRNAGLFHLPIHRRFDMNDLSKPIKVEPAFETREGFLAVGSAGEFQPGATYDIGAHWGRFAPRIPEIRHRVGNATYGICCLPGEGERDPERFTYVAAVEVDSLDDIPEGMTGVRMPKRDYAVFAYDGGIGPNLRKMVQYIFGEWLPSSGYEQEGADFEYYDDRFDPESGRGTFYICVPVRKKSGSA